MADLKDLVVTWAKLEHEKLAATAKLRAKMADLQAEIDALEAPVTAKQTKLEKFIKAAVVEAGGNDAAGLHGIDEVKIMYRAPHDRRTWNMDGLDSMRRRHPQVWKLIKKFRGETSVSASFSIKLA